MAIRKREIGIGLITGLIFLGCICYFIRKTAQQKSATSMHLYQWVAPHPQALLHINQPASFVRYFLEKPTLAEAVSAKIPEALLQIFEQSQTQTPWLFSFHETGIVAYAQMKTADYKRIESYLNQQWAAGFSPEKKTVHQTEIRYFPESGNRFLGCFYEQDLFVCSYTKKLLEEVADLQYRQLLYLPAGAERQAKAADKKAIANLLLEADLLQLYINLPKDQVWQIRNRWLEADLFSNEGKGCYFSTLPHVTELDTLYSPLADTLTKRITTFFPSLELTQQVQIDNDLVYYTGCSK